MISLETFIKTKEGANKTKKDTIRKENYRLISPWTFEVKMQNKMSAK
jgi:hypothetical protein